MPATKKSSKISERLKDVLEERIVTGIYLPGTRLDETELAKEFEVSRTPVREALILLSSYGLVEIRPRRGSVVAGASPKRLYEMFEVMAELEAMSAKRAARRHNEADMKRIHESLKASEKALESQDIDLYYQENEAFHMAIFAACHNSFLYEMTSSLFKRLGVYRRLQLRIRGRLGTSRDEHLGIVDALAQGDGELASQRIYQHVVIQGELFSDLIASISGMGLDTSG